MSKLNTIREMLQKVLATFERIATDKALIEFDGDELEVGMAVHGIDDEGNQFDLENGEYRADDGTVYVVEDGKVTEVREAEVAPEPDAEPEAPAEEPVEPEMAEEEPEAEPEAEPEEDPRDERIRNLEAEVARLEEENGALRERIAELEGKPAAEPAEAEFEKVNKVEKTGNKRLDNLNRILNA